ncbi:MAG: hypothetical protein ACYS15_12845 [Planctomycetota bacterium]|jgi:hypothetical protein
MAVSETDRNVVENVFKAMQAGPSGEQDMLALFAARPEADHRPGRSRRRPGAGRLDVHVTGLSHGECLSMKTMRMT